MNVRTNLQWVMCLVFVVLPGLALAQDKKASSFKGEYLLQRAVYGAEDGDYVCKRFKDNLNRFRKLDFDTCHPRMSDKSDFSRPYEWEEIPFDLALAERAIKSGSWSNAQDEHSLNQNQIGGDLRWRAWLKSTEAFRSAGKARMWTTNIDIDDDGEPETLLRLMPQGRDGFDPKQDDVYHCDYDRGELYVIEAKNPKTAGQFNFIVRSERDIVQDGKTGIWYLLHWSRYYSGAKVGGVSGTRDAGGTRGVIIRSLSPRYGENSYNPGVGLCIIDWVPEGHFKPAQSLRPK